jgi:23S rRNA (guanosine2251-2'-O)-methyltransferase
VAFIYGIHAVAEALAAAPRRLERILVERGQRNPRVREITALARERGVPLGFEERAWLDRKVEGQRHQGVVAVVAEVETAGVEEVLDQAGSPGLVLVLDGVEDPHNLGAVIRSAEVAGADGVLLPERRGAGLGPAAVRASAGAAAHVRLGRFTNAARTLGLLKERGYWVAGLAAEGRPLWEADFTVPTALVLGGEASGLHRLVRERCDFLAGIPLRGRVASYNVSVAAGIALYEVLRQRAGRARIDILRRPAGS